MMRSTWLAAILAGALTAGCMALWPPGHVAGTGTATGTLEIHPVLSATARFRTQTVVTPLSSPSVEHVVVRLFTVAGSPATESAVVVAGSPVARDVARADLGGNLVFGNLRHETTYRVRGYAYRATGSAEADLISVNDESMVDVAVGADDRPVVATLPVQLADVPFDGTATGSVAIVDGAFSASGSETVVFEGGQ